MPNKLSFSNAYSYRMQLDYQDARAIRDLYARIAAQLSAREQELQNYSNMGSIMQQQVVRSLQAQLTSEIRSLWDNVENSVQTSMFDISSNVLSNTQDWLAGYGINTNISVAYVSRDIVQSISLGKIYDVNPVTGERWSLSSAIWGHSAADQQAIQDIIAIGLAQGKSAYDIAKDLEIYVNPEKQGDADWSKIYPGKNRVVDYNALRLARTLVSHAYQQSIVRSTLHNPFVEGLRWSISNSHRVCEACIDLADTDHAGLGPGVFRKDSVPLDHPNGMCSLEPILLPTDEIADRLAAWVNGEPDPDIDEFVSYM